MNIQKLEKQLKSRAWRLNNIYTITDTSGKLVKFKLNPPQRKVIKELHPRLLLPKSRQLGMSTLICNMVLDTTIHTKAKTKIPIIDKDKEAAKDKLSKIKLSWEQMDNKELHPDTYQYGAIQKARFKVQWTKERVTFTDQAGVESEIYASTNARGGTSQFIFSSELGYIDMTEPKKAHEVLSGAMATAHDNTPAILESTMHCGRSGVFYNLVDKALQAERDPNKVVAPNEFKVMFLGWQENPAYVDNDENYKIPEYVQVYFNNLELNSRIYLTDEQKVFYAKTRDRYPSWDLMFQEFPTTLDEALSVGGSGTIYGPQIEELLRNKRVGNISPTQGVATHCFWDLGFTDGTVAIIAQVQEGACIKILEVFEERASGPNPILTEVAKWEIENNTKIQCHYLPHDGRAMKGLGGETYEELFIGLGHHVEVIPRAKRVWIGIDMMRKMLKYTYIHESCAIKYTRGDDLYSFIDCLQGYHKKTNGEPNHNHYSHSCDAFRMIGEAVIHGLVYEYIDMIGDTHGSSQRDGIDWDFYS